MLLLKEYSKSTSYTLELGVAVGVAMFVGRASDIDTVDTIDQSGARVFSLSSNGILHYYAPRGCSRRLERAMRKEGRHMQQTAVEVPSVATQFLKNILCQMYDMFRHSQTLLCLKTGGIVCITRQTV